ncbi:MAG: hypothetical protein SOV83_01510 [Prevotella sp.]|nr:hypothetical protein [Prevotella sp.]
MGNPHQSLPDDPAGFSHSFVFSSNQLLESDRVLSDWRASWLPVCFVVARHACRQPSNHLPANRTKPVRFLMEEFNARG